MDENIINDAEFTETTTSSTFNENNDPNSIQIPLAEVQQAFNQASATRGDKIIDYLGTIFSLLLTTGLTAIAMAFFLTFIPSIHFTIFHCLKCWSGIISTLLLKGLIQTKLK